MQNSRTYLKQINCKIHKQMKCPLNKQIKYAWNSFHSPKNIQSIFPLLIIITLPNQLMQSHYINITVYDQTSKKSRTVSILSNSRLSQLRQLIEKEWDVKDFRFVNEGSICIKGTQKHVPLQIYLKAFSTITIATVRQQPKKQSKIIQKQTKKQQPLQRHTTSPKQQPQKKYHNFLSTQQIIQEKHFKWSKENIEYCNFKYGIQLSQDGYGLDHDYTKIDMDEFTKYDWANIQWLGLYGCEIDDKSWSLLVERAHLFPRLKILGVKDNMITNVKDGDLEAFKSLRLVEFGTMSGSNPLSEESRDYLKRFKQDNKHIRVKFRT